MVLQGLCAPRLTSIMFCIVTPPAALTGPTRKGGKWNFMLQWRLEKTLCNTLLLNTGILLLTLHNRPPNHRRLCHNFCVRDKGASTSAVDPTRETRAQETAVQKSD